VEVRKLKELNSPPPPPQQQQQQKFIVDQGLGANKKAYSDTKFIRYVRSGNKCKT
tara:strand:+ start:170 stop:334 length:165 start_codon:yes stop_codon:yes gene_type:complete